MLKRMMLVALTVVLLVVGVGAASAQDVFPQDTITVIGSGTAYGEPDVAYVELGVEQVEEDLSQAFNSTADTMNAIIAALEALGIAREDMQTTGVNIYPEDRYDQSGAMASRVYRVRNTVRVTVREIGTIDQVISTGVDAGANTIYNLSYGIEEPTALEDAARVEAVEDARMRAQRLADALGLTVGDPVIVTEVLNNSFPYGMGGGGMMEVAQSQPVLPGQLSVSLQVQITFAIGE